MKTLTEGQLAKLPKWAQEHILFCERRALKVERQLLDYHDTQSESLVYVQHGIGEKQYIQSDRVTFRLKHGTITVALEDENQIECHASYGSARLAVLPYVCNKVSLAILPDAME